jgi:hypothetical protein
MASGPKNKIIVLIQNKKFILEKFPESELHSQDIKKLPATASSPADGRFQLGVFTLSL